MQDLHALTLQDLERGLMDDLDALLVAAAAVYSGRVGARPAAQGDVPEGPEPVWTALGSWRAGGA